MTERPPPRTLRAFWIGPFLGLVFLVACFLHGYYDAYYALMSNKVSAALGYQQEWGHVLPLRLLAFIAAAILVHLAMGFAAFALGRVTHIALPRVPDDRPWLLTVLWFLVLAVCVFALNTTLNPASVTAATGSWMEARLGRWPASHWIAAGVCMTAGVLIAIAAWKQPLRLVLRTAWPAGVLALALAWPSSAVVGTASSYGESRPHIVILGIDSLRDDLTQGQSTAVWTPNLDTFLSGAHRFTDTVTPLARTYGSWVSILTGRHPVSTNARFNLMPRSMVRPGDTLASALRNHGYRSTYATDEVRFANIDESFGFDKLVTPPIGASDFVLGPAGDVPLVNLFAGTLAGAWLFPQQYANRAVALTYRPQDFVSRLDREIQIKGPSFLAIHLTLAHWPYVWAGGEPSANLQKARPTYLRAIEAVDRQFGQVMQLLERKGVLENAYVVVLSDHGEALGFPDDSMLRQTGKPEEVWNSLWGHGTSVMSAHQYGVVLSLRAFGRARLPAQPGKHDFPASLEDVRPTLEQAATGRAPSGIDGISLLPFLAPGAPTDSLESRIRFTETCFNTPMTLAGRISVSGLIDEGAAYYEMDPSTGWVQLRPDRLPEIMAKKQRAALSRDSLLAAIPSWTDDSVAFLYSDRRAPRPKRLERRPDSKTDPEAARLWDALQTRFPGELPAEPGLPRM